MRTQHAVAGLGLKDLFSSDIAGRIQGVTPVLSLYDLAWYPVALCGRPRQREVEAWLHQNSRLDHPWIAIDDRPWWFESECDHVLVTQQSTGFNESDGDRLEDMIQRRMA